MRALPPPRLWENWKVWLLLGGMWPGGLGCALWARPFASLGLEELASLSVGCAQECAPFLRLVFGRIGKFGSCLGVCGLGGLVAPFGRGPSLRWGWRNLLRCRSVAHRSARPSSALSLGELESLALAWGYVAWGAWLRPLGAALRFAGVYATFGGNVVGRLRTGVRVLDSPLESLAVGWNVVG